MEKDTVECKDCMRFVLSKKNYNGEHLCTWCQAYVSPEEHICSIFQPKLVLTESISDVFSVKEVQHD